MNNSNTPWNQWGQQQIAPQARDRARMTPQIRDQSTVQSPYFPYANQSFSPTHRNLSDASQQQQINDPSINPNLAGGSFSSLDYLDYYDPNRQVPGPWNTTTFAATEQQRLAPSQYPSASTISSDSNTINGIDTPSNRSDHVSLSNSSIGLRGSHFAYNLVIPPQITIGSSIQYDETVSNGTFETLGSSSHDTPNTLASSSAEDYSWTQYNSANSSPGSRSNVLVDMKLPESYVDSTQRNVVGVRSSFGEPIEDFQDDHMEIDSPTATTDFSDYGHVFSLDRDPSFSPKPSLQYFQDLDSGLTFSRRQFPWSHEDAHRSETLVNANPGVETFGPEPGVGFYALHAREQLKTPVPLVYGPERPPAIGYDDQGRMRSNSADDDHASVERPSRTSEFGSHLHVLSFPRSNVAAGHGGRIGQLSQQQAEQARQRRSEGACWVCRLTKRKCGPCSKDSPCPPCQKALKKNTGTYLSRCFKDRIEDFYKFLIPDYTTSHLTQADVESFVNKHASHWDTDEFFVGMSWGGPQPFTALVVAVAMKGENSQIGIEDQKTFDQNGRPKLIRKNSPPLGILQATVVDLEAQFREHTLNVLKKDLLFYVSIAYDDQSTKLTENLLRSICEWYLEGVQRNDECKLLAEVIQMHVTSTILERSLILDNDSMKTTQARLKEEYPKYSAARLAQRQLKLAFFTVHRLRVVKVLRGWGKLLSDPAVGNEGWASCFCVLLVMILFMDKTILVAQDFCENNIKHYGEDPDMERRQFAELVRLLEKEVFERYKELFHVRYKTRKGGNGSCNPIRDDIVTRLSKTKGQADTKNNHEVDLSNERLVGRIRGVMESFNIGRYGRLGQEPRPPFGGTQDYSNLGRLTSIFLSDF